MQTNSILTNLDVRSNTKVLTTNESHSIFLEQVNKYLNEDRFNYIITAENIKSAKTDNADFNKARDLIKEVSKNIVNNETETVEIFKKNIKEYLDKIENKRLERAKSIAIFEAEDKDKTEKLLQEYADSKRGSIREEFWDVDVSGLVKLSSITSKGVLKKSFTDGVDNLIQVCINNQNSYDLRVSNLKVTCFENGLDVPLEESHIQGIVFEKDENVYQDALTNLIVAEIDRVELYKKKIQADADKKAQQEAQIKNDKLLKVQLEEKYLETIKTATEEDLKVIQIEITNYSSSVKIDIDTAISSRLNELYYKKQLSLDKEEEDRKRETETEAKVERKTEVKQPQDTKIVSIEASFEIQVPNRFPDDAIIKALRKRLEEAGITSDSLKSLEVV